MSSDEDDVVVPLMRQFLLNSERSKNKLWMHEINEKREARIKTLNIEGPKDKLFNETCCKTNYAFLKIVTRYVLTEEK
ncbi:Hypothetical protein CINCED_3A023662 [Cinara cedri]|uniref:Uncharacterized protein n=1 Tax=Cinara cedri TaxID=506608 RepID=A0A5E4MM60_9HEMI|nr:Hypothetical protein CINCED_3A023662 [Cinara cedri]